MPRVTIKKGEIISFKCDLLAAYNEDHKSLASGKTRCMLVLSKRNFEFDKTQCFSNPQYNDVEFAIRMDHRVQYYTVSSIREILYSVYGHSHSYLYLEVFCNNRSFSVLTTENDFQRF